MRRISILLLVASPVAAAPLDPQTKPEYRWRVVVSAAAHPTVTPAVREQLCRDLKVALQDDLGEALGVVDVMDLATVPAAKRDTLLASFALSGWPALDREEFRKLSGVKTHFVQLDVKDGRYLLSARQHDGDTGLTSPMIRTKTTPDIAKVGRLAGLLVARDFGPVATVERVPGEPLAAKVKFRGGELAGFEPHVKVGDVLAFSVIREQPRPPPKGAKPPKPGQPVIADVDRIAQPRDFTYLLLTEAGLRGEFAARVLTRWAQPFPTGRNVAGYRAMKWATAAGPLAVKLTDEKGNAHPPDFRPQVWAGEGAFTTAPSDRESFRGTDGVYQSLRPMTGVACVTVRVGTGKAQGFPVPVLGADLPTVLKFNIDEKEVARAEYEQLCESVDRRVGDLKLTQGELFRGLGALITGGEFKTALDRATKGLKAVTDADKELSDELAKLGTDPMAKDSYTSRVLAVSADKLKSLRTARPDLEKKIEDLKQAIQRADDPVRFEREFKEHELLRQVREFVARGEVPDAAGVYDQLFELTKRDDVKVQKDKLLQEWAPKTDDHRKARDFLLEEWRKASELAEFASLAAKLPGTVDVFAAHNDRLGLLNLRGSIVAAGTRLKDLLEVLDPTADIDAAKIKDIKAVDEALAAADKKAAEALGKMK